VDFVARVKFLKKRERVSCDFVIVALAIVLKVDGHLEVFRFLSLVERKALSVQRTLETTRSGKDQLTDVFERNVVDASKRHARRAEVMNLTRFVLKAVENGARRLICSATLGALHQTTSIVIHLILLGHSSQTEELRSVSPYGSLK
jgi:hypothetical protein